MMRLSEKARKRNNAPEVLARCPGMELHYDVDKNNKVYPVQFQCHTSRAVILRKGDHIFLQNSYFQEKNRVVRLDAPLSFWGIIQLG